MVTEYEEFVEKFKPKLTTDDCYTPDAVYAAVRDWAVAEYGLGGREVVRPFWPGADYESFDYLDGCVVIDNPPFSILAKIKAFYNERRIDYFLLAPHLTLFSGGGRSGERFIVTDAVITYENGAKVNTSFITNLDAHFIRTAPELKQAVEATSEESKKKKKRQKYIYPDEVISAALLGKISSVDFKLDRRDCAFVRSLDSQRKEKKEIFGSGFLLSQSKAAELRAAELRAVELRAVDDAAEWALSETEKAIISKLG